MFKTHEIAIGTLFRCSLGILGVLVIVTSLVLLAQEVWLAFHAEWLRVLTAGFLVVILAGGVSLLRSAIRGRLAVRSHKRSK